MRTALTIAAAAAIGMLSMPGMAEDKTVGERVDRAIDKVVGNETDVNNSSKAPALPAGIKVKESNDVGDIRGSLITIVNRTLTTDELDNAISYLANQDRDRIKNELGDTFKNVNGRVEELRGIFKTKYGEDFELRSNAFDGNTFIQQGEIENPAVAKTHWPLPSMSKMSSKSADTAAANDDPKLETGRDVAVVGFNAGKDKMLTLSMQHELPDYWVLDIPNTVNAATIVKNQTNTLQKLIDAKDNWPKDKTEAYNTIASKILSGYFGDSEVGPQSADVKDRD